MTYGLDVDQLREYVIVPVHTRLDLRSPVADALSLGTALHESHARYIRQIKGPAIGLWQMEGPTHADHYRNFLKYKPELKRKVIQLATWFSGDFPDPGEMSGNLYYACAMARIHYLRVKEPLPKLEPRALAQYWKDHYNTKLGKGTVEQALPHFERAIQ